MSDKNRVFKANFTIADLREHRNHKEVFTTACDRRESYQHFVLKLLSYCLFSHNETAILNARFSHAEPDVSIKALDDHYQTWLTVDQPDILQLNKIAKRVDELWVVTTLNNDWLKENEHQLELINNGHLIAFDNNFIEELASHLTKNLQWDVTIDQQMVSVSDKENFYQTSELIWH
ncbi:YaeQ family protein [Pseudoalteromonas sp.]|uniref:YaeQ family protein n=1 Tax=Pseudoalteromonas TaxID=53246 RepID=UPI00257BAECD|nr:YaeQ family protein [Pseudoalteromonas sp.]